MENNSETPIFNRSFSSNDEKTINSPSSTKINRAQASFQIVRCNKCLIQTTKKDFPNHKDSVCRNFIQSYLSLCDDRIINKTLHIEQSHLFEIPLLYGTILFTSSVSNFTEEKLKNEYRVKYDKSNVFLPLELMEHLNLKDGDYASIYDFNENIEKGYYTIQSCNFLKSCLTVGFPKDNLTKKCVTKPSLLRIRLKVACHLSRSLNVTIQREFSDPIIYFNICGHVKKCLTKKVIDLNEDETSVVINDVEYQLKIDTNVIDKKDSLEEHFQNLSLCSRKNEESLPKVHCACIISPETKVIFPPLECCARKIKFVGYFNQYEQLRSLIFDSLHEPQFILLTGPNGTGKTLAMRNLLKELNGQMNVIRIPSYIYFYKSFEFEKLNQVFKNLIKLQPSLLFLDNLQHINDKNKLENGFVSWLKELFDCIPEKSQIIVIGATNRPELLDDSLRKPGSFNIEIDFPVPTPSDRRLILTEILKLYKHDLKDEEIDELASIAHGFTGADLRSVCKESKIKQDEGETLETIHYKDLLGIIKRTKPSTMRAIVLEKPNVRWSDIGGLRNLKLLLEECVVLPIKNPEVFLRLGIDPPKGILMYGPPGCCKTVVGKALANESGLNFFSIKGPELFSKWVGESERAIRELFRKARAASPSILFFDEIDALASERGQTQSAVGDRVLAQLLTEIDGIEKLSKVIIIAATNRPDIVDKALLRPGRLDSIVYVPLPDEETRKEIFKIRLGKMPLNSDLDIDRLAQNLAEKSEKYSGAEINAICQRAALFSLRDFVDSITEDHFNRSFEIVRPQTSQEQIDFYKSFASKYNLMNHG